MSLNRLSLIVITLPRSTMPYSTLLRSTIPRNAALRAITVLFSHFRLKGYRCRKLPHISLPNKILPGITIPYRIAQYLIKIIKNLIKSINDLIEYQSSPYVTVRRLASPYLSKRNNT